MKIIVADIACEVNLFLQYLNGALNFIGNNPAL